MRLTFLTHYYPPERGAPQTRLSETVRLLVDHGARVSVVTCAPHYPGGRVHAGYSAWRPTRRVIDGATVIRLPVVPRPNAGFLDRVVDQASFAAAALAALPVIRRSDVFIVESPPLFLGGTAALLARLAGVPYIFHVADPWPDFPIAAGALRGRFPIAIARWLERVAYRNAALITTVTPPIVTRLAANPAAAGKVRLLSNTVDTSRFDPHADGRISRRELGWPEAVTFVYLGTVGLAQGVGTLLDAVGMLPADCDLIVRVVGDGLEAQALRERAAAAGITRIAFHPSLPARCVPMVLAAADAVLVLLRRGELYDESLPTKLLEGFAAGRPVIISAGGYAASLVTDAGAGMASIPEDASSLRDALVAMAASSQRSAMATAGRALATQTFARWRAADLILDYAVEATTRVRRRAPR